MSEANDLNTALILEEDVIDKTKKLKGSIAWMAGNTVTSNLLMLILIIGGFLYFKHIKKEVFPAFDLDLVTISVAYPGSSPKDVENGIILAAEEAVRGVDGIKKITSKASEGFGVVNCELLLDANRQQVYQDIKSEIDKITTFPEKSESPNVTLVSRKRQVLELIIYGNTSEKTLRELSEQVRDRLLSKKNISQIEMKGIRNPEISVEVPQNILRKYNLTLSAIASKIKNYAIELPGGSVKTKKGEILVRMDERRDLGSEFKNIPILVESNGSKIYLKDIANIVDGFEDVDVYTLYNGKPAIILEVYRIGDQTPIGISDTVKSFIKEYKSFLPKGINLSINNDRSIVYKQRAELMMRNGYLGLSLVFILLGLFLEIRLAFWVMMGIPTSFLGAFLFLPLFGISINVISMFAFIIALGIVVDDAIVVGENIYEYRQRGLDFKTASALAAKDVAIPVTFSILTNIVTFFPLMIVPGVMGKIFVTIPVVVITTFIISWVESIYILPSHLSHKKEKENIVFIYIHKFQQKFSKGFYKLIQNYYAPFLDNVLKWRYVTVALGLALLIGIIGYVKSGRMGFEMFPKVESDYAYVGFSLPYGTPVEKTEKVAKKLLEAADKVIKKNGKDKLSIGTRVDIGNNGAHTAQIFIYLTDPDIRTLSTTEFVKKWRKETGVIVGLDNISFMSDRGGPGSGKSLSVELTHRNIKVLKNAGGDLAKELEKYAIVKDIDDGFQEGKSQFTFKMTSKGQSMGLTAADVGRQIRNSFYGSEAIRQQRGRNELKVMARLPEKERKKEYYLNNLILKTPEGKEIPLYEAAKSIRGRAYTVINRRNQKRTITVSADVNPRSKSGEIVNDLKTNVLPKLIKKYPGLSFSFEGRQADQRESIGALIEGLLYALFGVYILLAIPFKSYIQPLIIMVAIPFGIVGAVLGHLLMGYSLSIVSVMGIVALAGVVVNDSLVLLDYANKIKREGKTSHDSICLAGVRRFRPIILTTLTTFLGLAPMIFETSRQAKFLIPMALSLGYGLLFATMICLVLIPCLYLMSEDFKFAFDKIMKYIFSC